MRKEIPVKWLIYGGFSLMIASAVFNQGGSFILSLLTILGLMFGLFGLAGLVTGKKKREDH